MKHTRTPKDISLSWFEDVWNRRSFDLASELFPDSGVAHIEGGGQLKGSEDFLAYQREFLDAFPDMKVNVLGAIEDGNDVCVRWEVTATHTGSALGYAPTGKTVKFSGMTWHRIIDGKIVEGWDAWNQAALFESLAPGIEHPDKPNKAALANR